MSGPTTCSPTSGQECRRCDGCYADLRRIRNPLIIFASHGDNITPPHQALGWIPAVYEDTQALKDAGQRIVYLLNPHVGHLGIFVSAKVARLEHRAILESLDDIEALEPGLYEMIIDNPTGDPDCHKPQYAVRFEERKVEDLRFQSESDSGAFERVRALSQQNESFYRSFLSPWVQAVSNPWSAGLMKWMHLMRAGSYLFSEAFNPWMRGVKLLADGLAGEPLPEEHPSMQNERQFIAQIAASIEGARKLRDSGYEQAFDFLYGNRFRVDRAMQTQAGEQRASEDR